jgi:hypothetical protein
MREWIAGARSAKSAFELVADMDWPPGVVSIRVLDEDGREVHAQIKGEGGW